MISPLHHRFCFLLIAATTCFTICGCQPPKPKTDAPPQAEAAALIATHNKNVAPIDQLWARAVVEFQWRDDKGKHFEQGEGNLLAILPDHVALSIGKLGHTLFWIGCDSQQYWLFDLRDNESVLYLGRHDQAHLAQNKQLPLPVMPLDLIRLLGIMPINQSQLTSPITHWTTPPDSTPGYQIETPLLNAPTQTIQHLLDTSARPVRIDLTANTHNQQVTAQLSRYRKLKLKGVPPGGHPDIPTRIQITHPDHDAKATLYLSDPSDGRTHNRLKPKAFNLERLIKALKPQKVVNLDQ